MDKSTKNFLFIISFFALAIGIYLYRPYGLYFLADDFIHIPESINNLWTQRNSLRPIGNISLHIDYLLSNISAKGYHVTNLLLHLINTFLVFLLGRTLLKKYDIVSLLIGVNNQYRGRSVEEFENEFESLLNQALQFSENEPAKVFVLSIPDWGVTPFAKDRDKEKISAEIDQYNSVCKNISEKYLVTYIDITTSQRADKDEEEMVAGDGLHPSKKEYTKWASKLAAAILNKI